MKIVKMELLRSCRLGFRSKRVSLNLPKNKGDELPFPSSYFVANISNHVLKFAFISQSGIVFNRYHLPIIRTAYLPLHHFKKQMWRALQENALAYLGRNTKPLYLSNEFTYLVIHTPWFNYYHWIEDMLARIFVIPRECWPNIVLLIPEAYRSYKFVLESLSIFPFKSIEWIPTGRYVIVPSLICPEIRMYCANYHPDQLWALRNFILHACHSSNHTAKKYIYVGRKGVRRVIINEIEVIEVLKQYHFEIHYFEDYSFWEQVRLMQETNILIAAHGAALTNMHFMQSDGKVLELHKAITNQKDHHSVVYYQLASCLGLTYFHQICQPEHPEENFFISNLIVDIQMLKQNLEDMIEI